MPTRRRHDPDRDATLFDRFAVAFAMALVGGLVACVAFVIVGLATGDYPARPAAFVFPIATMALAGFVGGALVVDVVLLSVALMAGALSGGFANSVAHEFESAGRLDRPWVAGAFVAFVIGGTVLLMLR